nr:NACHT, LRR and PYD domains-containing protein 3-like [Chrysemys picta bellii]
MTWLSCLQECAICQRLPQRIGRLGHCSLTAACSGDLFSASSTSQRLTELELKNKKLGDSQVQLLWEGPPDCKKQKIQLQSCSHTTACCGNLSSVLSTSQTLTELDLKNNTIRDSGVQLLCEGLKHPNCKLQKLGLEKCDFTAACCGELSSALSTSPTLAELDLQENKPEDSGVKLLCEGLTQPACNLQKRVLSKWHVTKETQAELDAVKKIKPDLVIER